MQMMSSASNDPGTRIRQTFAVLLRVSTANGVRRNATPKSPVGNGGFLSSSDKMRTKMVNITVNNNNNKTSVTPWKSTSFDLNLLDYDVVWTSR